MHDSRKKNPRAPVKIQNKIPWFFRIVFQPLLHHLDNASNHHALSFWNYRIYKVTPHYFRKPSKIINMWHTHKLLAAMLVFHDVKYDTSSGIKKSVHTVCCLWFLEWNVPRCTSSSCECFNFTDMWWSTGLHEVTPARALEAEPDVWRGVGIQQLPAVLVIQPDLQRLRCLYVA